MQEEMEGYGDELMSPQTAEEHELEIAERLHIFASRLNKLAAEQVAKRNQIEQRWLDDIRQYHGEYASDEAAKLARAKGSEVFVNITRNKTNAAEARLQDMLFPTDDRNFGIYPTPVPELDYMSKMEPQTPEQQGAIEAARNMVSEATESAMQMQDVIDDQLLESRYHIKARDIIHDACQLGTAIIKGPVIVGRTKKRWDVMPDGMSMLQIVEALEPTVERIDPWDFYPDMSAKTISEAEFVFERRRLSKKQLREMANLPGILVSQLREIVKTSAKSTHIAKDFTDDIRNITGINTVGEGNKYEIWEYHGPVSKSELIDAMRMSDDEMDEEEIDELTDEVEATVFFSGDRVIKVAVNPMDSDERPFAVFNWEKDESSIFGFGVPCLMRSAQRVINASWRMMMDNAGLSVADQLVINKELLYPADGTWDMTPKKIWYLRDKTRSVQEAFASFATPSHQVELANIFSMARQLADEETNLPLIAQGEMGPHTTKTSSGMAMLMNSSNIVLRKAVKNWDDDITRPLITRFYDWNMQFNERADIKGDFSIEARGSGALLVREKQQENLMIYSNLSMNVPEFAKRRDWAELDREIAKSLELPYDQITLDEREIAELEEQQQAMMQQQMQMMQAGGGADQLKAELAQVELQLKSQKLQLDAQKAQAGIQQDQAEMQMKGQLEAAKLELEARKLELQERIQLAELRNKYQMSSDQLQTKIALDTEKIRTDRDKAAANTNVRLTDASLRSRNISNGFDTFG
tara:strand:- start:10497 stop:12752 length:2256 start_codon:yes stop_codon:yes gene_type:complete